MLFDAHTHLNFEEYTDEERRTLAGEIEQSELAFVIDVGDNVSSSRQALKDSEDYEWCYAAVGIHPSYASKYTSKTKLRPQISIFLFIKTASYYSF